MEDLNTLKRRVCKIGIAFLGVMLLLTMISKTIYTLLLPKVERDKVTSGAITTEIYSNGKVGFDQLMIDKMQVVIKAPKEGQVINCNVKENDTVKKGDPLLEIQGEANEEKAVEDLQLRKEIEINIGACEREKESISHQYQNKQEELKKKQAMLHDFTDDYDILDLEQQIADKQQEADTDNALYEAGSISKSERDKARDSLKLMKEKYALLKEEHDAKLNEAIKEIQEKLDELQDNLLQQDEKTAIEKNKLLSLEDKQGKKTIFSPISGIVYEMKIGVGASASPGDELLIIIPNKIPITLTFSTDQDQADKIEIGDDISWQQGEEQRSAAVIKKTYDKEKENMIITCQIDKKLVADWITDYKIYKNVNISMTHKSERYQAVVPTSAISYEGKRAYVYSIEEKDTVFEKKYIVHKQSVMVIEEGDETSAIDGMNQETAIVVSANKLLKDNAEVRVE